MYCRTGNLLVLLTALTVAAWSCGGAASSSSPQMDAQYVSDSASTPDSRMQSDSGAAEDQLYPGVDTNTGKNDTQMLSDSSEVNRCRSDDDCEHLSTTPCLVGTCLSNETCILVPAADGLECDDGVSCTAMDFCSKGECVGLKEHSVCDDGNPCTLDECTYAGCVYSVAKGHGCNYPDPCVKIARCSQDARCEPVQNVECPEVVCMKGLCDHQTGECAYSPLENGSPCDDGTGCTSPDFCLSGRCSGVNTGVCNCSSTSDCGSLEDANLCNGTLTCLEGFCSVDSESVINCQGQEVDQCTRLGCNSENGACEVIALPDGSPCEDQNPCTLYDGCQQGQCVGTPSTDDVPCDLDGNPCTRDKCFGGQCRQGLAVQCPDLSDCIEGTCDQLTGDCIAAPAASGKACNDQDPCTINDHCDGDGSCLSMPKCTAINPCVQSECTENGQCLEASISGGACDDENPCTVNDTCSYGACLGEGICQQCGPASVEGKACDDGLPPTTAELCLDHSCRGWRWTVWTPDSAGAGHCRIRDLDRVKDKVFAAITCQTPSPRTWLVRLELLEDGQPAAENELDLDGMARALAGRLLVMDSGVILTMNLDGTWTGNSALAMLMAQIQGGQESTSLDWDEEGAETEVPLQRLAALGLTPDHPGGLQGNHCERSLIGEASGWTCEPLSWQAPANRAADPVQVVLEPIEEGRADILPHSGILALVNTTSTTSSTRESRLLRWSESDPETLWLQDSRVMKALAVDRDGVVFLGGLGALLKKAPQSQSFVELSDQGSTSGWDVHQIALVQDLAICLAGRWLQDLAGNSFYEMGILSFQRSSGTEFSPVFRALYKLGPFVNPEMNWNFLENDFGPIALVGADQNIEGDRIMVLGYSNPQNLSEIKFAAIRW